MLFQIIILIISIYILFIALFNALAWPKLRSALQSRPGQVSILIPARNEEANLPDCLDSAINQGDPIKEILVYDDHSTDRTSQIIDRYGALDSRVRGLKPAPLAAGWCGKNFACAQLANAAAGKYLLFIDADARLERGAVVRMVEEMAARNLTFLSCWPGLVMEGFWERLLMPSLNFVVFSIFPAPLSLVYYWKSLALAHGASIIFERERYFANGGHSSVHDQIFEDVRLAQLWRERGDRGLCLDGQDVVKVRMYNSFPEIWRGFQKNFFPAFRHEINFWLFLFFHAIIFLAPFVIFLIAPGWPAAAVVSIIILVRIVLTIRFRHPIWSAILHPFSEVILIAIGLSSWRRCKSGEGVVWKGRTYQA